MDGKYIIQNHKIIYEHKIKPFSPKTKPWTPRTKPWTQFQDLYILGDFSNPKAKVTRSLLSSFKVCVCGSKQNTNTSQKYPHAVPSLWNKTPNFVQNSIFIHASKTLFAYISFQLLIHIFQHLKNKR